MAEMTHRQRCARRGFQPVVSTVATWLAPSSPPPGRGCRNQLRRGAVGAPKAPERLEGALKASAHATAFRPWSVTGKKGMFFTLSALLLCASLLEIATLLSQQSADAKQAAIWLLSFDNAISAQPRWDAQVARIVSANSNITVDNGTVKITEWLPYSPAQAGDLERFSQFVAGYSGQNATMNLSGIENGTFFVQPGNTTIRHMPGLFFITPKNVPGGAESLVNYSIDITFELEAFDNAVWDSAAYSPSAENDLPAYVRIHDTAYAADYSFNATLDKYNSSRINITSGGADVGHVAFGSPGALEIGYSGNITLKTSAKFSNSAYVQANGTIATDGIANRTSLVRIA